MYILIVISFLVILKFLIVSSYFYNFWIFFYIISFLITILLSVAFLTLLERKVLSSMQRRKGPNVVGFLGFFQPIADGLKLILKETIFPIHSNKFIFLLSPIFMFFLSLLNWLIIPFNKGIVFLNLNLGILYIFAISSLSIYGIILSGWSSNSKYAFLGSLRATAQMISYEIVLSLIILNILLCVGSLNLIDIVIAQKNIWFIIPFFPLFFFFFISILAETNRIPFDLPEAEGELVSGYNIEYSAAGFALFFLAEYANILLMSHLIVICFFGGWMFLNYSSIFFFEIKVSIFLFIFIWIRATFPRYRYDQLMFLGWKVFLPLTLGWIFFYSSFFFCFDLFF